MQTQRKNKQASHFDVIILGAGAAGLLCAIEAGKRGRRVLVLDKANKPGKKILISGGGRCNFTNLYIEPDAYLSQNPHFCKSALARYTQWDFIALVEKHGLTWHEKTLGQLFCDQKAPAIVKMLLDEAEQAGVTVQLQTELESLERAGEVFTLQTSQGTYRSESCVVATGGPSIPRMGATDIGVQLAKQFGLKNIPFSPALVPFTCHQDDLAGQFADLPGVSLDVQAQCGAGSFREHMLFTHRGVSGPAMLQVSSYWQKGEAVHVNLLPDENVLDWLQVQQQQRPDAQLKTVLNTVFPKKLAQRLCETVLPEQVTGKPLKQLSDQDLGAVAEQLSSWSLVPAGTEGMRTAEVCLGGVNTDELSSKTMEAKQVQGLYFIGETVDVTGWLGGYNFQWAWASGWCAGQYV